MAAIQDGQQYVKAKDLPKHSSVWFLLQVSKLTLCFVPLCSTMYHYGPQCTTMYHHVSLCTTMFYYVLLCTTMFHCVPLYSTMYHYVLLTAMYHYVPFNSFTYSIFIGCSPSPHSKC